MRRTRTQAARKAEQGPDKLGVGEERADAPMAAKPKRFLQEDGETRQRTLEKARTEGGKRRMEKTIRIKYHSKEIQKLEYIAGKSDWIDLRVAENLRIKKGEFRLISMGVSVQLPEGYEMLLAPRSSTFKNFGLLQTNSVGVVDESYNGDNDVLRMPVYATRDTELHVNDRIAQFRILEHQPHIRFDEVESLGNADRGGFGTTGVQ